MKRAFNGLAQLSDGIIVDDEGEIPTPLRISQEEINTFKTTFKGYEFYQIPIFACTTCGNQIQVSKSIAPDKELLFYLKFNCDHYKNPKDITPQIVDPTQPA